MKLPGTLDELGQVVIAAEQATSLAAEADQIRPPETWETWETEEGSEDDEPDRTAKVRDPITLTATTRWVRHRVILVCTVLLALIVLMPEVMVGTQASLIMVRERLGTESALMTLQQRAASHLTILPPPLGFGPGHHRKSTVVVGPNSRCGLRVLPEGALLVPRPLR